MSLQSHPLGWLSFLHGGSMRVVIFANGEFRHHEEAREKVRLSDCVIAADGGTRHALVIGVTPNVVIGDLDSLSQTARERLQVAGVQMVTHPAAKDETDLELALLHAVGQGASEIDVLAGLGGRLDQMLANVMLLTLPQLAGIRVRLVEGPQSAFLIRGGDTWTTIDGEVGDTVSLVPLAGDAAGVSTQGLQWPLDGETLYFGRARGVSNVLQARPARVHLQAGLLLCVTIRQGAS